MQKIIVGNWKMNGNAAMAKTLAQQAVQSSAQAMVVLCPPTLLIPSVAQVVAGSKVALGGQDCHTQPEGAFTGDISASMLKDAGCAYVIVGHSERRALHGESSELVRKKAARAVKSGLIPIICIGETLAQRDAGQAEQVVGEQLRDSIPEEASQDGNVTNFLLAYEPVWAIGSGKTPTMDDIGQMHRYIVNIAAARTGIAASHIMVLYGGSVKADNARAIMAIKHVGGVLVGGASIKAEEFGAIINAAI